MAESEYNNLSKYNLKVLVLVAQRMRLLYLLLIAALLRCPDFTGPCECVYTNTNGTMDKCSDYQGVLISEVS